MLVTSVKSIKSMRSKTAKRWGLQIYFDKTLPVSKNRFLGEVLLKSFLVVSLEAKV